MKTSDQQSPLVDVYHERHRASMAQLGIDIGAEKPQRWLHTPKCTQRTQDALDRLNAWNEKYPNVCTKCHGSGIDAYYQSVPYGDGSTNMPVEEPCEQCIEQGNCPRCGKQVVETFDEHAWDFIEQEKPCPHCGWEWAKRGHVDDVQPEVPECYCWEYGHDF